VDPVYANDALIVVHGNSVEDDILGTSDGSENQVFNLSQYPIVLNPDGSSPLELFVDVTLWDQAASFLESEFDSQVYKVEVNEFGFVSIFFGDGVNGEIPAIGNVVKANYRIGGGEQGNSVGVNALTIQEVSVPGVVQVYNPYQPSGGSNAESLASARRNGPLSLRALDRCVTLEDYEVMSLRVPGGGVSSARAAHLVSPFSVHVFIATEGVNPVPTGKWYHDIQAGTGLLGAVGRWLTSKKSTPTDLFVEGPTVVRPFLSGDVRILRNILIEDAQREMETNLLAMFTQLREDFGLGLPLSRVIQVIEDTRGVDFVNFSAMHRLPEARYVRGKEESFLASVFSVTDLQESMVSETYTVRWLNGNTFTLKGEVYGDIVDENFDVLELLEGVTHEIFHYPRYPLDTIPLVSPQFSIRIEVGSPAPLPGDQWVFSVDNYLGNISIHPYEMIVPTLDSEGKLVASEIQFTYGGGIG
jgi:hypothetical protein